MKITINGSDSRNYDPVTAETEIEIDLENYDCENDPEGIFDVDNMEDNIYYSFDSYGEYKKFVDIFDMR